jgi:hypothetical protein
MNTATMILSRLHFAISCSRNVERLFAASIGNNGLGLLELIQWQTDKLLLETLSERKINCRPRHSVQLKPSLGAQSPENGSFSNVRGRLRAVSV